MTKIVATKEEFKYFLLIILFIFLFNILYEYTKYKDLNEEEVYNGIFKIINIYDKEDYYVLKLTNSKFSFFTSIPKQDDIKKLQNINISILTTKIDFISFLKGFYSKSVYYDLMPEQDKKTFKQDISKYITSSHEDIRVQQLFNALFLAIPISKEYRAVYTNFGISHLIAISGFHLGIIVFIIYSLVYLPYSYFHQRYFPFRHKRYDILLFTVAVLFFYLLLTNVVPSLLRSFIMFVLGIYFLRCNIKLLSFQTLFLTFCLVLAFFPTFIFSISFWFSITGVFYIFLYLEYFKTLPKVFSFLFFNFWIFFVFNPIVHFFFYNTTYEQLLSPFMTLVFTVFYPFELFLHLISYSYILDRYLIYLLEYKMNVFEVQTPFLFFIAYVLLSLFAIFDKRAFICLNILLLGFNIYLYY
jgi:competence protein ComEC